MCSCNDKPSAHKAIGKAIRDKDLSVVTRVRVTTSIASNGSFKSITHSCGQSVGGLAALVDEAHRQHLLNCKDGDR